MAESGASASAEHPIVPHPAAAAEGQAAPVVAAAGEVGHNVHYFRLKDLTSIKDTDGEDSTFGEGYLELLSRTGDVSSLTSLSAPSLIPRPLLPVSRPTSTNTVVATMPTKAGVSDLSHTSEFPLTCIVGYFLPNDEVRADSSILAINA